MSGAFKEQLIPGNTACCAKYALSAIAKRLVSMSEPLYLGVTYFAL